MAKEVTLQQENLAADKVLVLLSYFKDVRKFKVRDLAQRLHYDENYLTQVRSGDKLGGEKLLHALETFYQLDNLKQVQEKTRQIEDLKREIDVLSTATIENFYAERLVSPAGTHRFHPDSINEGSQTMATGGSPISSGEAEVVAAVEKEAAKLAGRAGSRRAKAKK